MRNKTERDEFRRILLAERSRLMARLAAEAQPFEAMPIEAEDDQPPVLHDYFVTAALNDLEFDLVQEIDEALERLARGEFGVCEECGDTIGGARLRAIPWARRCIFCQERAVLPAPEAGVAVAA